ncbi:hypothetical protein AB4Y90_13925 [Chryseobacterium sp. 2TAF14]|uniref:ORC-CDC6 family AAA ATPase n=1 Tax=Chryseobacterium sp. 2TAF14 TaxID=3233007 RepID=UPI003F8E1029
MSDSLGNYILDRTESLDDSLISKYFVERDNSKILRLLDNEQYLLEGSRGVGKTMLMKASMLKSQKDFGKNSILPVWVSFEESIRIERISIINSSIDPFLQWTMGKILYETLNKLVQIKPNTIDNLNKKLSTIFNTSISNQFDKYIDILNNYIDILEKGDLDNNTLLSKHSPSLELLKILDNPQSFKDFLIEIIENCNLTRIIFLFDEAAHVFSYSQQEKFFTFFKTLRDPKIACKAAVYPGITNYGKYFERGQDAKELKVQWSPLDDDDVKYIERIIKIRLKEYDPKYWDKLSSNQDVLKTLCICSNGNPRFAFHIIDELENNKAFKGNSISSQVLINSIRSVFNIKWKEFETLKHRLIKYEKYIEEAELFIKQTVLPNLRLWNDKQRKNQSKLSIGFYITTDAYEKLEKIFSVLSYSNIINVDYSKKSVGHHKYSYYVTLNPSLLFTDLIIKDITELKNTSVAIENNQSYSEASPSIKELVENVSDIIYIECSNKNCDFKTTDENFKFCPKCGNKIEIKEEESLYKILRSHTIDNLKISRKIITRLKKKFKNIGEIYDSNLDDIRMPYIQDVRITVIKNAALEYMAG